MATLGICSLRPGLPGPSVLLHGREIPSCAKTIVLVHPNPGQTVANFYRLPFCSDRVCGRNRPGVPVSAVPRVLLRQNRVRQRGDLGFTTAFYPGGVFIRAFSPRDN